MNLHLVLEQNIRKYFDKKLMQGIIDVYKKLQKKHGQEVAQSPKAGGDFNVASFGYLTMFMMRYMTIAFGIVCLLLLGMGLTVNPESLQGLKAFGTFFVVCILLWLITVKNSGYIVYTKDWLYVKRPWKFMVFAMNDLECMKVKGKLTLTFKGDGKKVLIPLEGDNYVTFVTLCEQHFPDVVSKIPKAEYEKAKNKHRLAWSNRM